MRLPVVLLALVVLAQPFAVLGQSTDELSMLRLRVKDIESVSARDGHSVFSWRLAGLLTASSASLTTPYLLPEDLNAAKQLLTACSADISTLCADSQQAGPSSFPPDVFHTNIGNMKCLEQSFTSVSDACVDAAHVANDYMRQNKERLRLSIKQTAVATAFGLFQSSCSNEIATQCLGISTLDPASSVVGLVASAPTSSIRGSHHRRSLHKKHNKREQDSSSESSSDESQPEYALDVKSISLLSSPLGQCVSSIAAEASQTCAASIDSLSNVAAFVTSSCSRSDRPGGDDHGRSLYRNWQKSPQGPPPPPPSSSEESSSSEEDDEEDFEGGNRRGGHSYKYHHKDGGGIIGVILIGAVVVQGFLLCRRRRVIRDLRARVQQLEFANMQGVPAPPARIPYSDTPSFFEGFRAHLGFPHHHHYAHPQHAMPQQAPTATAAPPQPEAYRGVPVSFPGQQ